LYAVEDNEQFNSLSESEIGQYIVWGGGCSPTAEGQNGCNVWILYLHRELKRLFIVFNDHKQVKQQSKGICQCHWEPGIDEQ